MALIITMRVRTTRGRFDIKVPPLTKLVGIRDKMNIRKA